TTTTVGEVKQTADLSIQKADNVVSTARKAEQVSLDGRKSTEDTIEEMHRIKSQMDSIAESIVRLSEQSQAVGEIIATVDDIADQSNLLAVNASIEAARAGEHGRGFGVVAQEIRKLAEQSKQSTTAVRDILNDVQKAISQAVLVTEQGSKAVESGMKQSTRTGEAIAAMANTIVEAANAANQIAVSSKQQLTGMDQVALAMKNIKQASSQNVKSSKQAEKATGDLKKLGESLKRLAGYYKV
ncbi:MAG: methyl-accepting chemotaxis protein, partial [Thermodesulfobacteriota bacterium]|nr:methyl-accepting chemotaxis protein [Thermodesulfobacteriota bacterium]